MIFDEVIPGLFISSLHAIQLDILYQLNISSIISIGCELSQEYSSRFNILSYPKVLDHSETAILSTLKSAADFISIAISKSDKILVHCVHGQSRSVAVVIYYLIRCKNFDFDSAYNLVKIKKPDICINPGFLCQLYTLSIQSAESPLIQLIEMSETKSISQYSQNSCDINFYCRVCKNHLYSSNDMVHTINYSEMLIKYLDRFWIDYKPYHAGTFVHLDKFSNHEYTIIGPVCHFLEQVKAHNIDQLSLEQSKASESQKIKDSFAGRHMGEIDLYCPVCQMICGYYKPNYLLVCHGFIVVDLFVIRKDSVKKRRRL
jgi:hypothetical protein